VVAPGRRGQVGASLSAARFLDVDRYTRAAAAAAAAAAVVVVDVRFGRRSAVSLPLVVRDARPEQVRVARDRQLSALDISASRLHWRPAYYHQPTGGH